MGLEEPVLAIVFTGLFLFITASAAMFYISALASTANQPVIGVVAAGTPTQFNITLTYMHGPPTYVKQIVFTTNSGIVKCTYNATWVCDGPVSVTGDAALLPGVKTVIQVTAAPGVFNAGRIYGIVIIGNGFTEPAYFKPTAQ